jgi:hypothetical protein
VVRELATKIFGAAVQILGSLLGQGGKDSLAVDTADGEVRIGENTTRRA